MSQARLPRPSRRKPRSEMGQRTGLRTGLREGSRCESLCAEMRPFHHIRAETIHKTFTSKREQAAAFEAEISHVD